MDIWIGSRGKPLTLTIRLLNSHHLPLLLHHKTCLSTLVQHYLPCCLLSVIKLYKRNVSWPGFPKAHHIPSKQSFIWVSRPLFLLLVVGDRNLARPNPKTLWQKLYHGTFTASKGLQILEGGCVDVGGDARWAVTAGCESPAHLLGSGGTLIVKLWDHLWRLTYISKFVLLQTARSRRPQRGIFNFWVTNGVVLGWQSLERPPPGPGSPACAASPADALEGVCCYFINKGEWLMKFLGVLLKRRAWGQVYRVCFCISWDLLGDQRQLLEVRGTVRLSGKAGRGKLAFNTMPLWGKFA